MLLHMTAKIIEKMSSIFSLVVIVSIMLLTAITHAIIQSKNIERLPMDAHKGNNKTKLSSSFAMIADAHADADVADVKQPTIRPAINSILITTTKKIPTKISLLTLTDEIAISTENASTILANPQQSHYKHDQYTFDNAHPPCDVNVRNEVEIASDKSTMGKLGKASQIDATAKGYKPLVNTSNSVDSVEDKSGSSSSKGSIQAFSSSSAITSPLMTLTKASATVATTFNVARNGFRDKINISNQRNEFSNVDDGSNYKSGSIIASINNNTSIDDDPVSHNQQQQQPLLQPHRKHGRSITNTTTQTKTKTTTPTTTAPPAESSFFERVEELESNLSPDEHHELLLHRRKRYLVFPEGSSFQLVFDLIIGIVDYTSYAILGITCSVAWELPSKPPSEIIENVREKLNEGTFGLQRRNDTITNEGQLQYVDIKAKAAATQAATIAPATKFANFENDENAWKPQFTISNYYNEPTMPLASASPAASSPSSSSFVYNKGSGGYYKTATEAAGVKNEFDAITTQGDKFAAGTQRKTFNEKYSASPQKSWQLNYANSNTNRKYYNNNNNNDISYKIPWNFDDKQQKYAAMTAANDWHHDGFSDNVDAIDDHVDYSTMPARFAFYQRNKLKTNYAGQWQPKDNNWWHRNKQRLQAKWHDKQPQTWPTTITNENNEPIGNGYTPKNPITAYGRPVYRPPMNNGKLNYGYGRTGRQRQILKAPPKHRIYPVFGRRKRSLFDEGKPLTPLAFKIERIHFREQLESRQKLFGKIEQIFKTRGHNGTECVLRALCETGQRQLHHRQHENGPHYHHRPHAFGGGGRQQREPQSFITELLRAIFTLPRDIIIAGQRQRSRQSVANAAAANVGHDDDDDGDDDMGTELDLEFELQRHQQRVYETQIPWHYRTAHTYAGSCAQRFASCELSIWEDAAALDNGFEAVPAAGHTFKM